MDGLVGPAPSVDRPIHAEGEQERHHGNDRSDPKRAHDVLQSSRVPCQEDDVPDYQ